MKNVTPQTYTDLGNGIRDEILKVYRADSCIATSRATIDALRSLRIDCYALPVVCMVTNQPLWEYADAHGSYPTVGSPDYPEGGYGVGVGFGTQAEKVAFDDGHTYWAGHLVVIAERQWLLDFSIDQAARPGHGIEIGPVVIPVTEPWLRARYGHEILAYQKGATRLHYLLKTGADAEGYKASPNWAGADAPQVNVRNTNDRAAQRADRRKLVR